MCKCLCLVVCNPLTALIVVPQAVVETNGVKWNWELEQNYEHSELFRDEFICRRKNNLKKTRASLLNTLTAKNVRFIYRNKTLGVGLVLKLGQTVSSWYIMRWLSVICSSFPVFTAATQIYLIYTIVSSTGKYNSKCLYVEWWYKYFIITVPADPMLRCLSMY